MSFHARAPPVGYVEYAIVPKSSTAVQNFLDGQETAVSEASTTVGGTAGVPDRLGDPGPTGVPGEACNPGWVTTRGSTSATLHGLSRVGSLDVSTRPAESTATHSFTDGQARAVTVECPKRWE